MKPKAKTGSVDKPSTHRARLDPISDAIGSERYYYNMIWPEWFVKERSPGVMWKLAVSRYYPEKNLALDLNPSAEEQQDIPLKQRLLAEKEIKYFVIKDEVDVRRMLKSIGRPV